MPADTDSRPFLHAASRAAIATAAVSSASLAGLLLGPWLSLAALEMLYLLVVMLCAYFLDRRASIIASVLGVLSLNYLFIPPHHTLRVDSLESWIALITLLATSLLVSSLTAQLKQQTARALRGQQHANAARRLGESLGYASSPEGVARESCQAVATIFQARTCLARAGDGGQARILADSGPGQALPFDLNAVQWVSTTGHSAGPLTGNWPDLPYWCVPVRSAPHPGTALFLEHKPGATSAPSRDDLDFLQALAHTIGLALEREEAREREKAAWQETGKEAVRNSLLMSLSHDFRTPLAAILGAATSLRDQSGLLDSRAREALLETISDEAAHMAESTGNILTLARLSSAGAAPLRPDWESVEEIIGTVVTQFRRRHPDRTLRTRVDPDIPLMHADAPLISQLLSNLVENACKYDPSGHAIEIQATAHAGSVRLCVLDHGPGFPAGALQRLPDRFERGPGTSHIPGIGLGLSICKAIAEVHGGSLELGNRPGGGAQACAMLPVANPPGETLP